MLSSVSAESTARLHEVGSSLRFLDDQISKSGVCVNRDLVAAKGLFFVHLYSVLEFTVTATVRETILAINKVALAHADIQPLLLSLALDNHCESLAAVGRNKSWQKRWELFRQIKSPEPLAINDNILPTDGSNIQYQQLESIWTTFCIREPVLPDIKLKGRLAEVVEKRNAIAHGREAAGTVGGRFTTADLQQRYSAIDQVCMYVVQVFTDYLKKEHYRYP